MPELPATGWIRSRAPSSSTKPSQAQKVQSTQKAAAATSGVTGSTSKRKDGLAGSSREPIRTPRHQTRLSNFFTPLEVGRKLHTQSGKAGTSAPSTLSRAKAGGKKSTVQNELDVREGSNGRSRADVSPTETRIRKQTTPDIIDLTLDESQVQEEVVNSEPIEVVEVSPPTSPVVRTPRKFPMTPVNSLRRLPTILVPETPPMSQVDEVPETQPSDCIAPTPTPTPTPTPGPAKPPFEISGTVSSIIHLPSPRSTLPPSAPPPPERTPIPVNNPTLLEIIESSQSQCNLSQLFRYPISESSAPSSAIEDGRIPHVPATFDSEPSIPPASPSRDSNLITPHSFKDTIPSSEARYEEELGLEVSPSLKKAIRLREAELAAGKQLQPDSSSSSSIGTTKRNLASRFREVAERSSKSKILGTSSTYSPWLENETTLFGIQTSQKVSQSKSFAADTQTQEESPWPDELVTVQDPSTPATSKKRHRDSSIDRYSPPSDISRYTSPLRIPPIVSSPQDIKRQKLHHSLGENLESQELLTSPQQGRPRRGSDESMDPSSADSSYTWTEATLPHEVSEFLGMFEDEVQEEGV